MMSRAQSTMIQCACKWHYGSLLVTFDDGRSILLQSDYDQAAFAVACGLVTAPADWDGRPSLLPDNWADGIEDIDQCTCEYYDISE